MRLTKTEIYTHEQNELAVFLKAMAHPARIAILQQIMQANACICRELAGELTLTQSTISQHTKSLKNVGLIRVQSAVSAYVIALNRKRGLELRI